MAVAKIYPADDIINGLGTVSNGNGTQNHDDTQRTLHLTSTDNQLFNTLDGRFRSGEWSDDVGVLPSSGDYSAPSGDTDAILTLPAQSNQRPVIYGVAWSYDATPTSGNLLIQSPSGTSLFTEDISAAGPGFFDFPKGLKGRKGGEMVVTLFKGGSGVSGKVNVKGHRTE